MSDKPERAQSDCDQQDPKKSEPEGQAPHKRRELPAAAQRALAEAEARRRAADAAAAKKEREVGGRDGPDPARYGDWEKGGIISDF
jgi:hypothetical protein